MAGAANRVAQEPGAAKHRTTKDSTAKREVAKRERTKREGTKLPTTTTQDRRRIATKPETSQPDPNDEARRKRSAAKRKKRYDATFSKVRARLTFRRPEISLGYWAGSGWHTSKLLSIFLILAVCGIVFWFHWDDRWFIYEEDVSFENLTYLEGDELYPLTGLESWNLFWLEPEVIEAQIKEHPYIRDAYVQANLFGSVTITVDEEYPVALWLTDSGMLWVLADGTALPEQKLRSTAPLDGLLRILDRSQAAYAKDQRGLSAIDMNVLIGANTLMELFPGLQDLRYDKGYGLNFALPGSSSVWVYWGDGTHTEDKLKNLKAARKLLNSGEVSGNILDLRYPNRSYFKKG